MRGVEACTPTAEAEAFQQLTNADWLSVCNDDNDDDDGQMEDRQRDRGRARQTASCQSVAVGADGDDSNGQSLHSFACKIKHTQCSARTVDAAAK